MFKILIILMFAQVSEYEPKTIPVTIALDDGFKSKLLHSEMTRDWTKPKPNTKPNKKVFEFLKEMNEMQKSMVYFDIKFIKESDINSDAFFLQGDFPKIKIRRTGEWEEFHKDAFRAQTYPLRTMKWIYDDFFYADLRNMARKKWRSKEWELNVKVNLKKEILLSKLNKKSNTTFTRLTIVRNDISCMVYDYYKKEWVCVKEAKEGINYRDHYTIKGYFEGFPVEFIEGNITEIIAFRDITWVRVGKDGEKYRYVGTKRMVLNEKDFDQSILDEIKNIKNEIKKFHFKEPTPPWDEWEEYDRLQKAIEKFNKKFIPYEESPFEEKEPAVAEPAIAPPA